MIRLIKPSLDRKEAFWALFQDFDRKREVEWCQKHSDAISAFHSYVERLEAESRGVGVNGWVPTSHFWLLLEEQIIGTLRLRHYLTPTVREDTGHVGYDISPSFRGKGYGHEILKLGLHEAEKLSMGDLLIHSVDTNIASVKVIQKQGGVVSRTDRGQTWYWIKKPKTETVVREAYPEEAEIIARVHVSSWQSAYRGLMPDNVLNSLSVSVRTAHWSERLSSSTSLTLALVLGGTIKGFASLGPGRDAEDALDWGELYGIYLLDSCWSTGLGALLYSRAETALRALGFEKSYLWVLEENQRARRFYSKMNYRTNGQSKLIELENMDLPEIRLEKTL